MKIGVVGCGLMGSRRAAVASELGEKVVLVADVDSARAQGLAEKSGGKWSADWREVVGKPDVDIVVVSTVNKLLAPVTVAALKAGKHVLCEKPLGRNAVEAREMVEVARQASRILKVGFNHRHHPAIWKAHEICWQGAIGPLMFVRAVYGHGGRPGYGKEWRADPELAGGGELLDQGVHILDLCRWFMGDFSKVFGCIGTYFWDLGYFETAEGARRSADVRQASAVGRQSSASGRQLEDNAFALLRTADGRVAQFHTSWTQWKNRFSFEAFGRDGYVRVEGLGASYGMEHLEVGRRNVKGGPPDVEVQEFPGPDRSWHAEWQELTSAICEGRQPTANGDDGLEAMRLIAAIYESSRTGKYSEPEPPSLRSQY